MVESEIANTVRDRWSSLTKSDRVVARRLLAEYPSAGLKTLAELAAKAGVSAPSVIRFVKKLGFGSYPEFQRELHDEIQASFEYFSNKTPASAPRVESTDTELAYTQSIRKTVQKTLDSDVAGLAATIARTRSSVLCLGGRVSHALAMIFHAHLLRLRRNVELVSTNPVERAERLMDVGRSDLVILFDFKPYDSTATSFARLAFDNKATIVCFTDFEQSPVAEYAKHIVLADNRVTADSPSLAAALCSAEIVLNEVRNKIGASARSRSRSFSGAPEATMQLKLGADKA